MSGVNIIPGNLTVNNSLNVTGNMGIGGDTHISGIVSISGSLVTSSINIDAGVTDICGASGSITLSEGTGITITQSPSGTFTFSATGGGGGGVTNPLTANLDVSSYSLFSSVGLVSISGSMNVSGSVTISDTLTVGTLSGIHTLNTQAISSYENVNWACNAANCNVDISGYYIHSSVGLVNISGNTNVSGSVTISDTLTVNGNLFCDGGGFFDSYVKASGNSGQGIQIQGYYPNNSYTNQCAIWSVAPSNSQITLSPNYIDGSAGTPYSNDFPIGLSVTDSNVKVKIENNSFVLAGSNTVSQTIYYQLGDGVNSNGTHIFTGLSGSNATLTIDTSSKTVSVDGSLTVSNLNGNPISTYENANWACNSANCNVDISGYYIHSSVGIVSISGNTNVSGNFTVNGLSITTSSYSRISSLSLGSFVGNIPPVTNSTINVTLSGLIHDKFSSLPVDQSGVFVVDFSSFNMTNLSNIGSGYVVLSLKKGTIITTYPCKTLTLLPNAFNGSYNMGQVVFNIKDIRTNLPNIPSFDQILITNATDSTLYAISYTSDSIPAIYYPNGLE